MLMAVVGSTAHSRSSVEVGFAAGALGLGIGTTMMYSNLLAAVADEVAPSWRASALGTCVPIWALAASWFDDCLSGRSETLMCCTADIGSGAILVISSGQ